MISIAVFFIRFVDKVVALVDRRDTDLERLQIALLIEVLVAHRKTMEKFNFLKRVPSKKRLRIGSVWIVRRLWGSGNVQSSKPKNLDLKETL